MASLFNTKISDTYVGLIKTLDTTAITATLKELSDGNGNSTGLFINTSGDFKVTAILEWGSLKDTGTGITITNFVDSTATLASNKNDTTIPTSKAVSDYVDTQVGASDLDFSGDSGTGAVILASQTFAVTGTTNQIETTASGTGLALSLPSTVHRDLQGNVTGNLTGDVTGNVTGNVTGDLTGNSAGTHTGAVVGNVTGDVTGDLTGTVTATSSLADGVTATSQALADDSTKVATTAFVQDVVGTIPAGLVFQGTWNASTNTPTLASGTGTTGHFYIVSVAGTTDLDGVTDWAVGDWAVFVEQGATDQWEKVDNSSVLDGNGTGGKISKWAGSGNSVTLTDSVITEDSSNIGIGVSSPSQKLEVAGNLKMEGSILDIRLIESDTTNVNSLIRQQSGLFRVDTISDDENTITRRLTIDQSDGAIQFNSYGAGTLVSDASGNITSISGGGEGGPYLPLAGGIMVGNTDHNDSVESRFGNSGDFIIKHTGSTYLSNTSGDLYFRGQTTDGDIIFQNDDGSGGITTYVQLNGSTGENVFYKNAALRDSVKATFGNSNDLQIYHDGSNSYIDEGGTGGLKLESNSFIDLQTSGGGAFTGRFINGGAVELYHAGTKKFETTSYGVSVTSENSIPFRISRTGGAGQTAIRLTNGSSDNVDLTNDGSNNFTIATGGTERMRIDSSGTVTIKNPTTSNLQLQSDQTTWVQNDVISNLNTFVSDTSAVGARDVAAIKVINEQAGTNTTMSGAMAFYTSAYNATVTERMRIDSAGQVGIGTDNPQSRLDLSAGLGAGTGLSFGTDFTELRRSTDGINLELANWGNLSMIIDSDNNDTSRYFNIMSNGNDSSSATELLRVTESGNVGIGTTSPDTKLELLSTAASSDRTIPHNVLTITAENANLPYTGFGGSIIFKNRSYSYGLLNSARIRSVIDSDSSSNRGAGLAFDVTNSSQTYNTSLFLKYDGNVGIGETSPSAISSNATTLTIKGKSTTKAGALLLKSSDNSVSAYMWPDSVNGLTVGTLSNHNFRFLTNSAERMRIESGGNVGIGTTSPSVKLAVEENVNSSASILVNNPNTGTGARANLILTSDSARIDMYATSAAYNGVASWADAGVINTSSATSGGLILNSQSGGIKFQYATAEKMRIDSAGNVLIGTTGVPNGTSVYGSAFRTNSNGRMSLNMATSSSGAQGHIEFFNPNGLVGSIITSGSATTYNTSSDYRLKKNVVEMTGALDRVAQLKPSRFNFIADSDTTVDGFLAHEVQSVVPEAITGTKDAVDEEGNPEYQGIDQSKLVPLLVGAIQELKAEIELLKNK